MSALVLRIDATIRLRDMLLAWIGRYALIGFVIAILLFDLFSLFYGTRERLFPGYTFYIGI